MCPHVCGDAATLGELPVADVAVERFLTARQEHHLVRQIPGVLDTAESTKNRIVNKNFAITVVNTKKSVHEKIIDTIFVLFFNILFNRRTFSEISPFVKRVNKHQANTVV